MKLKKCRQYAFFYVDRCLILIPEFPNVTRLFLDVLFLSEVIRKPNKHVDKNCRSGKLAFCL